MKQILIILTLISTTFWSCSNQSNENSETSRDDIITGSNSDFDKYVSTLEQIPLTLKHNPLGHLPDISKNYDKTGFQKFKHTWTSKPLGIYYKDDQTIGIIDCSIGDWGLVPFLTIYDLNGNKIDSTSFYDKSGQDLGYEAIEYLTLNKNKIIVVVDTVKRWDINNDESDIIEGSMKMTTGKTEYRILENGRIEKK
jgi:hypothetical protein